MMLTLLDIGNSFTRVAEWHRGVISGLRRFPTSELSGVFLPSGPAVAVCVVPAVREALQRSGIFFLSALQPGLPVDFSAVDARTLGADRVANALALAAAYPLPGAVIDCGTCITMELVNERRQFLGGAIMPGRRLQREILHAGTGQLPLLPLATPLPDAPGKNTLDSMAFGVDFGIAGAIVEWLRRAGEGMTLRSVVLTGGDASFFAGLVPSASPAPDDFTLSGAATGYLAVAALK